MKRQAFVILTTLSVLVMLTATSVVAQSAMRFKVNIPFEFSVRGEILPAGEYTVGQGPHGSLVIQNVDHSASQFFLTRFAQASATRGESSLVFSRYGDQYFLSTICTAGDDTDRVTFKSRAEKHLIRGRRELARSSSKFETVSVVAHR